MTMKIDFTGVAPFVNDAELETARQAASAAFSTLTKGTGPGNDFLGWLRLPEEGGSAEHTLVCNAAARIARQSEVLVVIGIGGSYLGAKAAIDFCSHRFYNNLLRQQRPKVRDAEGNEAAPAPEVYFAGTNISGTHLNHLMQIIGERDFSVNVISKSGTTTEPALAFRFFKKKLEERYGRAGTQSRIYATTDGAKGALRQLANEEGYETFVIPDDVGGRFSVLSPVGTLPIAAAGIDTGQLYAGAKAASDQAHGPSSLVVQYAAVRNALLSKGKIIEMLVNYEPRLKSLGEWWKQLFGESEGKDGKGIFPATANYTADLHSMGQYMQDGQRILFETAIEVSNAEWDETLWAAPSDIDGLNYLAGKTMREINRMAAKGTRKAHIDGGVPYIEMEIPALTPYHLGELFMFFEMACAVSGYVLGVNPFDQPGVEAYKKNMFALLGKK